MVFWGCRAPDFAAFAVACGAEGIRVEEPETLSYMIWSVPDVRAAFMLSFRNVLVVSALVATFVISGCGASKPAEQAQSQPQKQAVARN